MSDSSVAARLILIALACAIPPACQGEKTAPMAGEVPGRQFILDNLRLEERRDGRVLWLGTGKRGDGDLSVSDVTDLVLVRKPQQANESEFTVSAPSGHLAFDDGKAAFVKPRVTEPGGGSLTATAADYDEKSGELTATGPIEFSTPSMIIHATGGVLSLREGRVDAWGPVVGRLERRGAGITPGQL